MGDVQNWIDDASGKTKQRRAERNAARAQQDADLRAAAQNASAMRAAAAGQSLLTPVREDDRPGMAGDVTSSTMLTGKKKLGPVAM